mgnify:CR=1 FL=1
MIPDYEEKRSFPRMTLNCEASLSDPVSGETFRTMVLNLSGGGALFNAEHAFRPGMLLDLRVDAALPGRPPFEARIKVIRCEARDRGGFQVASRIEEVHAAPEPDA